MKLVRARPKAVEDLPEWAKCCPEYIAGIRAFGEMMVDSRNMIDVTTNCYFCGVSRKSIRVFAITDRKHGYLPIGCLDLDETGVPDGNYVEAVAR